MKKNTNKILWNIVSVVLMIPSVISVVIFLIWLF